MHDLSGACASCLQIFDRYPGFEPTLKAWFLAVQKDHPEAHISSAGRGEVDQMILFQRGATRALWKQSAHNWNAAIDVWELREGHYLLEPFWFRSVIEPRLNASFSWYGVPQAKYFELPHIELRDWPDRVAKGLLHLVE